ncbi:hypothetical protein BAE44_0005887 [Dichanthelium oligosanthes]|uniref:Uncharacterized protein n=1 Tax=Dichanthelium oligosanthes TaxID=888268 RepID=A0A1E5W6Z7_9POAL|nr:hypothetical protein BAE44_0005887 [Dichanthelium oligosanthes]
MASSTKTARLLVLALFVVCAVIMPGSVCHGIRGGLGIGYGGVSDPNRPACIGRCPDPGHPYVPRPYYPVTPAAPSNGASTTLP